MNEARLGESNGLNRVHGYGLRDAVVIMVVIINHQSSIVNLVIYHLYQLTDALIALNTFVLNIFDDSSAARIL